MKLLKKLLLASCMSLALVSCEEEEDLPGQDDRNKFLGTWNISANGSQTGHLAYTIEILAGGSSATQINMQDFDFRPGASVFAEVDGNSLVVSPDNQILGSDTISGTGSYSNGQLTFHYTVRDGITVDVVHATGTR